MPKSYDSPDYRIDRSGKPALQLAAEAQDRQCRHDEWHEEHPGEPCDPKMFPTSMTDYADIERGEDALGFAGGGTVEPGDSYVLRGGK